MKTFFNLCLLVTSVQVCFAQGPVTPNLSCGTCYDPDQKVRAIQFQVWRSDTDPCEYSVKSYILSKTGPVSITIQGAGFSIHEKTIFAPDLTVTDKRTISPSETRYNAYSTYGFAASLANQCLECRQGNYHCSDPSSPAPGGCVDDEPEPPPGGPIDKRAIDDCIESPILIDLKHDGFQLAGAETAIRFDILGEGNPRLMHWVALGTDDVFLFRDIDGDGLVNDGSELFGNGTRMLLSNEDELAPNGFVGLAQFDDPVLGGNNDGLITATDEVWEELRVWNDGNANGICEDFEVLSLASVQLTELAIIPHDLKRYDEHGNWLRYWAKARRSQPAPRNLFMVDVFFQVLDR